MKFILIMVFGCVVGVFFRVPEGYCALTIPISIGHLKNLIFQPDNLYKPLFIEKYKFWEKNFSGTYPLKIKRVDFYEIGIIASENFIPADYKFSGMLKADFYHDGDLIFSNLITTQVAASYAGNNMTHLKNIILSIFEPTFCMIFCNNIYIKLTVLEPDMSLEKYSDIIKLYVSVSSIP